MQELLALAEQADQSNVPDGVSLPGEIQRREDRLKAMAKARAKARFEREQAEYQAKFAAREEKQKKTGKKPGGRSPKPPAAGPRAKNQLNLTDEESRIMPVPMAASNRATMPRQRSMHTACW